MSHYDSTAFITANISRQSCIALVLTAVIIQRPLTQLKTIAAVVLLVSVNEETLNHIFIEAPTLNENS